MSDDLPRHRQRVYVLEDHIVQLVAFVDAAEHKHGVLQLSISLGEHDHFLGPRTGERAAGRVQLVGSNHVHTFASGDGPAAIYWIEPESKLGARLQHAFLRGGGFAIIPPQLLEGAPLAELVSAFVERWDGARLRPITYAVLACLGGRLSPPGRAVHPAVLRAIRHLRTLPHQKVSAASLAAHVGLSETRFLHVFKEHTGTPLRAYLAWKRLVDAMFAVLVESATLTEAAHHAGFTDAAHLNHVMNQYWGQNPSAMLDDERFVIEPVLAFADLDAVSESA